MSSRSCLKSTDVPHAQIKFTVPPSQTQMDQLDHQKGKNREGNCPQKHKVQGYRTEYTVSIAVVSQHLLQLQTEECEGQASDKQPVPSPDQPTGLASSRNTVQLAQEVHHAVDVDQRSLCLVLASKSITLRRASISLQYMTNSTKRRAA